MKKFLFLVSFFSLLIISCSTDDVAEDISETQTDIENPSDSDDTNDSGENQENEEASETARYSITFIGEWTAESHPDNFPSNDHFSKSVLLLHCTNGSLFEEGNEATLGIENMAEVGNNTTLINEMQAAIDDEDAKEFHLGPSSISGTGTTELFIDANQEFYRISYVAMIAPSPDWFVGVSALDLIEDDKWINELEIDVIAYDAGTEDGSEYSYNNDATNPAQPISKITNVPIGNGNRLGYLRIVRQ